MYSVFGLYLFSYHRTNGNSGIEKITLEVELKIPKGDSESDFVQVLPQNLYRDM